MDQNVYFCFTARLLRHRWWIKWTQDLFERLVGLMMLNYSVFPLSVDTLTWLVIPFNLSTIRLIVTLQLIIACKSNCRQNFLRSWFSHKYFLLIFLQSFFIVEPPPLIYNFSCKFSSVNIGEISNRFFIFLSPLVLRVISFCWISATLSTS